MVRLAVAGVAGLALVIAAVHLPVVRSAVLRWIVSTARTSAGVRLEVREFSYNLLTLHVHVGGLTASADGVEPPFLTVEAADVDLPWRAVVGALAVQRVDVRGIHVDLVRGADGSLNLPRVESRTSRSAPARVPVGALEISGASLRYRDVGRSLEAGVRGLAVRLAPSAAGIAGRIVAESGPYVHAGGTALDGALDGRLAYDGSSVSLDGLTYTAPPGSVRLDGRLDGIWSTPAAHLTFSSTLDVPDTVKTLGVEAAVDGAVAVRGTVEGPLNAPTATVSLTSARLQWQHLVAEDVAASVVAQPDVVRLDRALLRLGSGAVRADGRFDLTGRRANATAEWQGVALDSLVDWPAGLRLESRLTGRAALEWAPDEGVRRLRAQAETTAEAPRGARGAGLGGSLRLDLQDGRWNAIADTVVADHVTARASLQGELEASELGASPLGGTVDAAVEASSVPEVARRFGLVPPSIVPDAGRIEAQARLGGTLASPAGTGELSIRDLRVGGSPAVTAALPFSADLGGVRVEHGRVTAGENSIDASMRARFDGGPLAGDLDVHLVDLTALGADVAAWRPGGALSGHVSLAGTLAAPALRAELTGTGLAAVNQPAIALTLDAEYAAGVVSASRVTLAQPDGGRITASGRYDRDGAGMLNLRASRWHVAPIVSPAGDWPVAAVIDAEIDAGGTWEHPTGGGHAAAADLEWNGMRLRRADLDLSLSDAGVGLRLDAPDLAARAEAQVDHRAPHAATFTATAEGTSVAAVVAAIGPAVPSGLAGLDGVVTARVSGSGMLDSPDTLAGEVQLTRLDLHTGAASLRLAQAASLRYGNSTLAVDSLRLESGTTKVEAGGAIGPATPGGVQISLEGALDDLAPWLAASGAAPELSLGGKVAATLRGTGSFERLTLGGTVSLAGGLLAWSGFPPVTDLAGTVTIADGQVSVPALHARWAGAEASAALRVPLRRLADQLPAAIVAALPPSDEPATLQARIDNLTPAALVPVAGEAIAESVEGHAAIDVDLQARQPGLASVAGSVVLRDFELTAEGLPVRQVRPTRLTIDRGAVHVADWTWSVADSRLEVGGGVELSGARAVDLSVNGTLDLRILGAFVPNLTAGGAGDLAVKIGGTMSAPLADGSVAFRDAELRLQDPRIAVSNLTGRILLQPNQIEVPGLQGDANGGQVTVIGGLSYRGAALTGGTLSIDARGLALEVPQGLRTEVNASLALAAGNRIRLSGQVEIVRGAYREPLSLAAGLVAATRRAATTPTGAEPSTLDRVDLNINVTSDEDLLIDNNYGRMDLAVAVRLVGTPAAPAIVGRASIGEGGVLYLGGRSYLIDRGVIDFTNPRAIVPDLDLSARTRVRGTEASGRLRDYDITVTITGTPDTLKADLSSDPQESQADIVSLLATGRLADQAGGMGAAAAGEQVLGYLSGDVLAFAAQAVGLDAIRFERGPGVETIGSDPTLAGEVDPVQRLTLTRRLARQVEISLSQNLADAGLLTWIVSYAPRPAIELRVISRDDRSRSYEARHDLSLGGPPSAERGAQAGSEAPRIVDVRVTGTLLVPQSQVERVLQLSRGDRFDFYRWQDDRQRLRAFYLERGYREVRVSARRVERPGAATSPGMVLEYHVDPGPHTQLEVEGVSLPGSVRRELEQIWDDAIIDVALIDDLTQAVRRHMASEGYLRATVTAAQQSAGPGEKRILVRVDPGAHSSSRQLQITGRSQVDEFEIDQVVSQVGVDAWLRPKTLADQIALVYEQHGFLGARVEAGPVEVADGGARLPVRIDEGSPFSIGEVTIQGAAKRSESDVRADFGVKTGDRYTPQGLRRADASLEAAYARAGYTQAAATVDTAVDRTRGVVNVRVTIDEGVRQVIQSVDVRGGAGVSTGVIGQALDLKPGQPVNLESWYAGRRRLVQTGLFQRVDVEPVPVEGQPTGADTPVQAVVTLVRRAPWRLRYGFDVSDTASPVSEAGRVFAPGASASLERYGLLGRPGTIGATVRINKDQRLARGFLTLPSLFGLPATTNVFLTRSRDLFDQPGFLAFVTDKTALTTEQRFQVRRHLVLAYGYQFERNHVFEPHPDPDALFPLDNRGQRGLLTSTLLFDTRNDQFDTHRGLFHASNFEYASKPLGSIDVQFVKYSLQQYFFAEPAAGLVTASAFRVGFGRGFGQQLASTDRFFAGGTNTVRGFADNTLGGVDFLGEPLGGQAFVVLNQELRFPVFRWVRGVGFVDAGQIFERVRDFSLRSLDTAAGTGVRVSTPFGLFRLDVAVPLPRDGRPVRWWFSLGQAF